MSRMDLHLVRVLVAVYELRSATAAAARLSVTQPSISYALGKLRDVYGEPLFRRSAAGLAPTMAGERLYQRFREALAQIDSTLEAAFDPVKSTRDFRVAMSDLAALHVLEPLQARLQKATPHCVLDVIPVQVDEVLNALVTGRLDIAIGNLPQLRASTRSELVARERFVCVVASNHPRIGTTLTLEQYEQEQHLMLTTPTSGQRLVEETLAEKGVIRKVAARMPSFMGVPDLIAAGPLVATVTLKAAHRFISRSRLRMLELPVPIPEIEIRAHWHPRRDADPARRWLLEQICPSS